MFNLPQWATIVRNEFCGAVEVSNVVDIEGSRFIKKNVRAKKASKLRISLKKTGQRVLVWKSPILHMQLLRNRFDMWAHELMSIL